MSTRLLPVRSFTSSLFSTTVISRRLLTTYPVTELCPSPTCSWAATPSDLDVDRVTSLANSVPSYSQHIVIATGKNDWASKIELEPEEADGGDNVAAELKRLLGRGGKLHNPNQPHLITNSSFPARPLEHGQGLSITRSPITAAYLFPTFEYISGIDNSRAGLERFAATHLLSGDSIPGGVSLDPSDRTSDDQEIKAPSPGTAQPIHNAVVLVCSHGGRDRRCGILGPLLKAEFEQVLATMNLTARQPGIDGHEHGQSGSGVAVGLVSHVGGHKWAGNVIIYVPPRREEEAGSSKRLSPLAGRGVWYGRVEPKHVEGIVKETLIKGNVIKELCRGVV